MNRRIFRYEIPVDDRQHTVPAGKIVHMTRHRDLISPRVEVWVEVQLETPDISSEPVGGQVLTIIGTGHPAPEGATHVATCLDGPLVWHLYRLPVTLQVEQ